MGELATCLTLLTWHGIRHLSLITVRATQTAYITDYSRRESRQPMTSYALGGCHQGNGFANDVFAMQRRPQFGFCPFCLGGVALCGVAAKKLKDRFDAKAFKQFLDDDDNHPKLFKALEELYSGIKDKPKLATALITIFKDNADEAMKLFNKDISTSNDIMAALEEEKKLYKWMKENQYV